MGGDDSIFDEIMKKVGDDGTFQRRFVILFNVVLFMLVSLANVNLYPAMAVPEHWCHVSGREASPYSAEEWKNFTIPRKNGTYSECRMYNVSGRSIGDVGVDDENREIIDCQHGWEYNKTWYTRTIPSQQNWVCGNRIHVANAFVFVRFGDLTGNLIVSQVADLFGRLAAYYLTLATVLTGRIVLMLSPSNVPLFMFATFFSSLAFSSVSQSSLVIAMEICKPEKRARIAMMQCIAWTTSFCAIPMIMWMIKDWVPFMLVTTLPCAVCLFTHRYLVESPRWLASRGKTTQCIKQLRKIAKANGTDVTDDVKELLRNVTTKKEKSYGMASLFSNWWMAKNSCLLVFSMIVSTVIYFILTLNVTNLGGNPHTNFLWQGVAELPAYAMGMYVCDTMGRRWTNIASCVGLLLGSAPLIFTISDDGYESLTLSLSVFVKFCVSLCFYSGNLQALEIYPTCVRQSGIALGGIVSNLFSAAGPYIVHLGTSVNPGCPYVITSLLGFLGAMAALHLPETLNQKLPETLAEAYDFGKCQKMWSFPGKRYKVAETIDDTDV